MKRIIMTLSAAALFLTGVLTARELPEVRTAASDARITYIGRTLKSGENVSFDWSGVYVRVKFEGNYLAMKASDSKANYYDVWIDREPEAKADQTIRVSGKDTVYVLASPEIIKSFNSKGKSFSHTVTIKKRTEGEQGLTTISEFITKAGDLLQAEGLKTRQFEVVGDSYTCGYGSENSTKYDPFKPETENSNLTYAAILARYFDADYYVVAHSGMGIARNYSDKFKDYYMPDRYSQTFDMDKDVKWDASKDAFKPQMTIIYLCTNDFSTGRQPAESLFRSHYITLLKKIKENYGEEHPILCVSSRCDDMAADYVRNVVNTCGMKNVKFVGLTDAIHNNESELGASQHPSYQGHRKIAHALLPYVSTMTGWNLNDDVK